MLVRFRWLNQFYLSIIVAVFSISPFQLGAITLIKSFHIEKDQLLIRSNIQWERQPKIGLVLSGGGARGVSHIGVLKALEMHDIPISMIVGSSMGSVIGGFYAAGYSPEQIEQIIKEIDWSDIFMDKTERSTLFLEQKGEQDRYLISIRFKKMQPYIPVAFSPGQKILTILSDLFLKARYQPRGKFDNLKIPFRAVATDLVSGKRVILSEGNLAECINGSLAIPLLFSPVVIDSMMLVDGGLLSNLPVDVTEQMGADITLAVDISSKLRPRSAMNAPWEIVNQVTTIMSEPVNRLQRGNADVIISPALSDYLNTDFTHIDEMIASGYQSTIEKVEQIKKLIQTKRYSFHYNYHLAGLTVPEELNSKEKCKDLNIYRKGTVTISEISNDLDKLLSCGEYATATAYLEGPDTALSVSLQLTRFPVLDSLDIDGNQSISKDEILSVLHIRKNKELRSDSLKYSLQAITQLYRDRGYSLMNIQETQLDLQSGFLSLNIDEGIIDTIRIEGNKHTKAFVISREFTLRQGDVFNWRKVNQSVQNIYATQLFDRVNVDIVPDGNRTILLIKVEEKSSVRMRIGGKIDNERRAQSYIEFGDDNFTSTGMKASILTRLGLRDGLLGINVRDNRIFKTFLTFTLQGYYSWQINHIAGNNQSGRYRESRLGARLQIGQQLRRIGQLSAELRLERVKDKTYSGNFTLGEVLDLRTFSLRSITDKRDRIDFPTTGIYNNWVWESGSQFLLNSQISYTKAALNLEDYFTLRENHTWHLRFMAGVGDESVPFSETYRLGGLHSFFGLLENQYYGRQIVLMNGEYRLKLPFNLMNGVYLGGRFDFGGVWEQPELLFDAEDFFSGAGLYLAMDTLLGPLYLAYGHMTEGRSAVYLSLGFNF